MRKVYQQRHRPPVRCIALGGSLHALTIDAARCWALINRSDSDAAWKRQQLFCDFQNRRDQRRKAGRCRQLLQHDNGICGAETVSSMLAATVRRAEFGHVFGFL
jgi:hypothetical protein